MLAGPVGARRNQRLVERALHGEVVVRAQREYWPLRAWVAAYLARTREELAAPWLLEAVPTLPRYRSTGGGKNVHIRCTCQGSRALARSHG